MRSNLNNTYVDNSNVVDESGLGNWFFVLYKPENLNLTSEMAFEGFLYTNSQFHKVINKEGKTVVSVPTGNVAMVYDLDILESNIKKLEKSKGK